MIRRASELAEREVGPDGGIEPEALVEAAADVGIPEVAVRRSIAIERLGPDPETGRLDALAGPAIVAEVRFVSASPDEVLDLLDRWLVKNHHLRRIKRTSGRIDWARRDDVVASASRAVRGLTGEGRLGTAPTVIARAEPVDGTDTVVRVEIDRSPQRRNSLMAGGACSAFSVGCGVLGVVVAAPLAILAIPGVVGAGVALSNGRSQAGRYDRELDRVLDAVVEQRPPSRRGRRGPSGRPC